MQLVDLILYMFRWLYDENFAVFGIWKGCPKILNPNALRSNSCAMTKMAVKRIIRPKHCMHAAPSLFLQ